MPYATIQDAIDAANSGDTIEVWSGTYTENIDVNIPLTIVGNNSANTIIDGAGLGDVVTIPTSGVNFYGFGVTNSGAGNTGILLHNADNCRIENNTVYGFPIGVVGKYTPAELTISSLKDTAYVTIVPVNSAMLLQSKKQCNFFLPQGLQFGYHCHSPRFQLP